MLRLLSILRVSLLQVITEKKVQQFDMLMSQHYLISIDTSIYLHYNEMVLCIHCLFSKEYACD